MTFDLKKKWNNRFSSFPILKNDLKDFHVKSCLKINVMLSLKKTRELMFERKSSTIFISYSKIIDFCGQ